MTFGVIVVVVGVVWVGIYAYIRLKRHNSLIPKGWVIAMIDGVAQNVAPSQFDISKLKPCSFLKKDESIISGPEMRRRAVQFKGNLGLCDGKRMLAEQDKIPKEFRDFYILLPGTLLRDPDGYLYVPRLYFLGGRWRLLFRWLNYGYGWDDCRCLACSASPARNVLAL